MGTGRRAAAALHLHLHLAGSGRRPGSGSQTQAPRVPPSPSAPTTAAGQPPASARAARSPLRLLGQGRGLHKSPRLVSTRTFIDISKTLRLLTRFTQSQVLNSATCASKKQNGEIKKNKGKIRGNETNRPPCFINICSRRVPILICTLPLWLLR